MTTARNSDKDNAGVGKRIGQIATYSIGLLAVCAAVFLLIRYAQNDWRLTEHDIYAIDVFGWFTDSKDTPHASVDERLLSRQWNIQVTDSAVVLISAQRAHIILEQGTGTTLRIDLMLEGNATDEKFYRYSIDSLSSDSMTINAIPTTLWQADTYGHSTLRITLPGSHHVQVTGTHSNATVLDCSGVYNIMLQSGNVSVLGFSGILTVAIDEGDATLERHKGSGSIRCGNGSISMSYCDGDYTVTSVGSLLLNNFFGSINADVVNGNIDASILEIRETSSFTNHSGNITVSFVEGIQCSLQAEAPPGQLHVLYPVDSVLSSTRTGLSAIVNGGGHVVRAIATDGDVAIQALN